MTFVRFTEIAGPAVYTIAGTAAQLVATDLERDTRAQVYVALFAYLAVSSYALKRRIDKGWIAGSLGSAWKLTGTLLSMVASTDAVNLIGNTLRRLYPNNDVFLLLGPVLLLLALVLATALASPSTPADQTPEDGQRDTFVDLSHVLTGALIMIALSVSDAFVAVLLSSRARFLGWRPVWATIASYAIIRFDGSLGFKFKQSALSLQWAAVTQSAMYTLARFAAVGYSSVSSVRHGETDVWLWVAAIGLASVTVCLVPDASGRMVAQQAIVSAAIFAANAELSDSTVRGPLVQGAAFVVWAGSRTLARLGRDRRASTQFWVWAQFAVQLLDAISSTLLIQATVYLFQDGATRAANTMQLVAYVALVIGIACVTGPM